MHNGVPFSGKLLYQISSWASWALRSVTPFRQAGPILVAGGQTQCHSNLPAVSAVWHIFGFESAGLMFNLFSVKIGRCQANPDRVRTSAWLCEYFKAPPLTLTILIATFPLIQNGTTFGVGGILRGDWWGISSGAQGFLHVLVNLYGFFFIVHLLFHLLLYCCG